MSINFHGTTPQAGSLEAEKERLRGEQRDLEISRRMGGVRSGC
jgi:hypothetical protein